MTQEQLSKTLFPCGGFTKDQIRALAGEAGLVTANKPESQDICFIPDGDYASFLERHFPELSAEAKGRIKHTSGKDLGEHRGIHSLTIGQRKIGVAFGEPIYVTGIDPDTKEVTVGSKEDSLRTECTVSRVNWIYEVPDAPRKASARIRSRGPEAGATIHPLPDGKARIVFDEPQHAITPGQAAVFYYDDYVLGGGWID